MDWNAAIDKNREALKRVLAMLVAMAGLGAGGQFFLFPQKGAADSKLARAEKSKPSPSPTLPRHLHRFVLTLLRPAEAAARRLIIVAARGLVVPPPKPTSVIARKPGRAGMPKSQNLAPRTLPLFDRLSPWSVPARPAPTSVPRISVPGFSEPFPVHTPSLDDPIDVTRLASRLQALAAALDDLPGQAKRFARWRARATDAAARLQSPPPPCGEGSGVGVPRHQTSRRESYATARPRRLWPLRPGRPPGWRRKPIHEVHEILDIVHGLAFWALEPPDTS